MNTFKNIGRASIITVACFSSYVQAQEKPNIVVVMADDLGVGDLGFYHKQRTGKQPLVPTPNIDNLIRQGMRFSEAHSPSSLCAPTRFSMMTGNYVCRNRVTHRNVWGVWGPDQDAGIEPRFTTVARLAKQGGYHTAFFGKWGMGGDWDYRPQDLKGYEQLTKGAPYYGFDYSVELPEGIQNVPYAFYENGTFMKLQADSTMTRVPYEQLKYDDEKKRVAIGSVADSNWDPALAGPILAQKATAYIHNQTDLKTPFYLYYCSQAVHVPHAPSAELNGVKIAGTTLGTHGDMIKELDTQVGMIVDALKRSGRYENTLFIFTSDNGGLNHDKALKDAGHDSSNGLRDKKGSIHEGGHRIPFIAVWPGQIKPNTESDVPMVNLDTVATIATLVGVPVDRTQIIDSVNLLPVLTQGADQPLHSYLLHKSQGKGGPFYALRDGDWKLIMLGNGGMKKMGELKCIELYNLKNNIKEDSSLNMINNPEQRTRIERMKAKYLELWQEEGSTRY